MDDVRYHALLDEIRRLNAWLGDVKRGEVTPDAGAVQQAEDEIVRARREIAESLTERTRNP